MWLPGRNPKNFAVRVDPLLAERVVDFHVQYPVGALGVRLAGDYRRTADRVYQLSDPLEREARFTELFLRLFEKMGFVDRIRAVLQEFPLIGENIEEIVLALAERPKDEGVDRARPSGGDKSPSNPGRALLRLQPSRFKEAGILSAHARFHASQLNDLVDPVFGYEGTLPPLSLHPVEQRAFAAAYTEVWNLHTFLRLKARGAEAPDELCPRWYNISRGPTNPTPAVSPVCKQMERADRLSHSALVELALEVFRGRDGEETVECSLCRFPSTGLLAWGEIEKESVRSAIRNDFPGIEHSGGGICGHCLERYELVSSLESGATCAA